jgi:hypothetical protein
MSAAIQGRFTAAGMRLRRAWLRRALQRGVWLRGGLLRRAAAVTAGRAFALGAALGALLLAAPAAAQQPNFQPLERGEFTEVEERLVVARGLEVGAEFGLRMRFNHYTDLATDQAGGQFSDDLRLNLDTIFNRDARVHLGLQVTPRNFADTDLRTNRQETGSISDGLAASLIVREAYLRYGFNPASGIVMGKQELSLGDRRGKIFDALVPGVTFDCKAGTWCMPFGFAVIGKDSSGSISHFALQYTAYDEEVNGARRRMQVELFRLRYFEHNIPLGSNLGPALYNPDDPTGMTAPSPSQLVDDSGQPVYYDVRSRDYYGLRVDWQGGAFFVNLDWSSYGGHRQYHLYNGGNLGEVAAATASFGARGHAVESEVGYRWETGRAGLRIMNATGDPSQQFACGSPPCEEQYTRALTGFNEITPGSYRGSRLWFNGSDNDVSMGAGLGHSINNTRLLGIFFDFADPDKRKWGYSGGLYQLSLNNPILDSAANPQRKIGLELDNMFTWYVHKQLKLQFEANMILAQGALRPDDFTTPQAKQDSIYQAIGRLVYKF